MDTLRDEIRFGLLNNEFCFEMELALSILSGKWKAVIIWHLGHEGILRYNEIHRILKSISNRILTKQLRELEQDGIITRKVFAETPPHVEYSITELGISILSIVDAMYDWGKTHIAYYIERAKRQS